MTFQEAFTWMKWNHLSILRLANQRDPLATRVIDTYRAWWNDKTNIQLQNEYLVVVHEMALRDLTDTERVELEKKYGHKLGEAPSGPKIIVPNTYGRA